MWMSTCRPHNVPCRQMEINDRPDRNRVTEWRHTADRLSSVFPNKLCTGASDNSCPDKGSDSCQVSAVLPGSDHEQRFAICLEQQGIRNLSDFNVKLCRCRHRRG